MTLGGVSVPAYLPQNGGDRGGRDSDAAVQVLERRTKLLQNVGGRRTLTPRLSAAVNTASDLFAGLAETCVLCLLQNAKCA